MTRAALHILPIAAAMALACGSATTGSEGDASDAKAVEAATCSWPSSLDYVDATAAGTQCVAARALVNCKGAGVVTCLSDAAICRGEAQSSCEDECKVDEYGVSCPVSQMSSSPSPPAGCRIAGEQNPEFSFLCCPCTP